MEQIADCEVDFDASPQNAQMYAIFNKSGVFCNIVVNDSVCLCYSNGSLLNGVTGNIKIHQIVSDTWQCTLSTKRCTLYTAPLLQLVYKCLGFHGLFLRYCGLTTVGSSAPHSRAFTPPQLDGGENQKGKREKIHTLR